MEDFRISGEAMNQLEESFKQAKTKINSSADKATQLLSKIESEKKWTGQSADAFFAYMDLMNQYHHALMDIDGFQPLNDAETALEELGDNIDGFYADFAEYKEMEKIE